jgi:hypothetical protein
MAVPGSVVGVGKLITPGGQTGPKGDAGTAANVPLADITQNGLLRKTSGNTTDFTDGTNNYQPLATAVQPTIWSARLRSFNSVGNPNFEVNQPYGTYTSLVNPASGKLLDRWIIQRSAVTATFNGGQAGPANTLVPGTNFCLTNANLMLALTAAQATLAAGDYFAIQQSVEGPLLRELLTDVHSISLLVYSTVANLKFGVVLRDVANAHTLTKLCTVTSASTWTLITLPNLPVWTAGATWSTAAGNVGYNLFISLACGSTNMSPANDTWQNGSFLGAPGMSNWLASPVNSTLYIAFVQHEPGPLCTTLQDKPFAQNYDECQRYYQKSYDYGSVPGSGSVGNNGIVLGVPSTATVLLNCGVGFKKIMAKTPTVAIYNHATGALNSVRDQTGVDHTISAINGSSQGTPFFNLASTGLTAGTTGACYMHYTADSGW